MIRFGHAISFRNARHADTAATVKRRITRFTSDQGYMPNNTADFFKDETLQKWNKLMPKGIGFVGVNDTSKYQNLPTQALDWGDDFGQSVYSTSVTHTLHCLVCPMVV